MRVHGCVGVFVGVCVFERDRENNFLHHYGPDPMSNCSYNYSTSNLGWKTSTFD